MPKEEPNQSHNEIEGHLPIQSPRWISSQEMEEILKERTADLAQVPPEEEEGEVIQILTFSLGDETYAIEAIHVQGIYTLEGLTPIPWTPDFVVGTVNIRGRIISVIHIHRFLGLKGEDVEKAQVILVQAADIEVGIAADKVHDVFPLPLKDIGPVLPTTTRIAAEHTQGVTPDMVVLLDLESLIGDERMIVREEVQ